MAINDPQNYMTITCSEFDDTAQQIADAVNYVPSSEAQFYCSVALHTNNFPAANIVEYLLLTAVSIDEDGTRHGRAAFFGTSPWSQDPHGVILTEEDAKDLIAYEVDALLDFIFNTLLWDHMELDRPTQHPESATNKTITITKEMYLSAFDEELLIVLALLLQAPPQFTPFLPV